MTKQPSVKAKAPLVSVKKGSCSIFFAGMPNFVMTCPLCGTRVRNGEQHQCENGKPDIEVKHE